MYEARDVCQNTELFGDPSYLSTPVEKRRDNQLVTSTLDVKTSLKSMYGSNRA